MITSGMFEELNVTVNSKNVVELVENMAERVCRVICKKMKGKMICQKVDAVSKYGRSVLGQNIQFIRDHKIVVRNIRMCEKRDRHKGTKIREMICDSLNRYVGTFESQLQKYAIKLELK